jgi:GNAT superfamily N-acetyltransferase
MEIRRLREEDERSSFSCGNDDLDRFFRNYAGQNQFRSHIGTTYVGVEGGRICGYATVSSAAIERDKLPAKSRKKLPPSYPLPVLRLARLGVARELQGCGIGKELLRFVFLLALKMRDDFGCVGVVVDAKTSAVAFYKQLGFFELEAKEGQIQARPQPAVLFLPIADIEAANG